MRLAWGRIAARRGVVLVLVLAVLSLLSLLAIGLCHRARLDLGISRMQSDQLRAYYLAVGGLRRAMLAIRQDTDEKIDHLGESWHLRTSAEEEGLLTPPDGPQGDKGAGAAREHVFYTVSDEEGRLNLNTSSPKAWMELPGVNETIVQSILDWQDGDESPNRDGAESSYYRQLSEPYRAKNKPIALIWELALIKGVSWQGLVGEDVSRNALPDGAENDGSGGPSADNGDGVRDRGLIDYFTVHGKGKVNLNTAGAEVLSALPGIGPEAARAIVEWRAGPDGQPFTEDDRFLHTMDELKQIAGLTERQVELLKEYGAVSSNHFRIFVEAGVREGGRLCRLMGVVRREKSGARLIWVRTMGS